MLNYSKAKIYCIRNRENNEIVWIGGTISDLKRRYWNHKSNSNDLLNKTIKAKYIGWNRLKIELLTKFKKCRNRQTLSFAVDVVGLYNSYDNQEVLEELLNNIDFYIDTNI